MLIGTQHILTLNANPLSALPKNCKYLLLEALLTNDMSCVECICISRFHNPEVHFRSPSSFIKLDILTTMSIVT